MVARQQRNWARRAALAALVGASLTGCGHQTRSVAYYETHPDDAKTKLQWCVAYPEQAIKDDDCRFAGQAQAEVAAQKGDDTIKKFLDDNSKTFAPPPKVRP